MQRSFAQQKKTFFVDEPVIPEDLIIFSFRNDKVVVNMGILEDDKVKIAKTVAFCKAKCYNEKK